MSKKDRRLGPALRSTCCGPLPAVPCQVSQESTWIALCAHLEITTPFQTFQQLPEILKFSGFTGGIFKPMGWPRAIISRQGAGRERENAGILDGMSADLCAKLLGEKQGRRGERG